MLNKVLATSGR